MTTLGGHPGRLETTRAATDDVDLLGPLDLDPHTGQPASAHLGVDRAVQVRVERAAVLVDAQAATDLVEPPGLRLQGQLRVGDQRAGHADQVGVPRLDDVLGRADVADPLADDGGHAGGRTDTGRRGHGHCVGAGGVLDVLAPRPVGDAEVVDHVEGGQVLRDPHAVLDPHATGDLLLAAEPDAEREACRRHVAHRLDHQVQEPHPVLEGSSEGVGAAVGQRRHELGRQVAVRGVDLDPVQAGLDEVLRRDAPPLDDVVDLSMGEHVRRVGVSNRLDGRGGHRSAV